MPVVSVKGVSKVFGTKKVLDNVSFDIQKGEVFGLLGSNGAGKSTLTSIILGLQKQSDGRIVIFDTDVPGGAKKKVALVPQDTSFYKDFTVLQNMRFFGAIAGLSSKELKEKNDYLLKWLELSDFKDIQSGFLSGGYQRLLNIAISLLHNPELIFLDEPTVGLDPRMRQVLWKKIFELNQKGKTIILTTHYMDEAEHLCSRVALMRKGSLIAIGSPQQLITKFGGVQVVVLKVRPAVSDGELEKIKDILKQEAVSLKGETLFIPMRAEHSVERLAEAVEWISHNGHEILSSITKAPDLEDVFLNLTGEKIVQP